MASAVEHPVHTETESWLGRDEHALASVLPRVFPIVAARGEGAWLFDVEGRRFLDLTSGIAVASTGHCHPHVVKAVQEQAARLLHVSVVTHNPRAIELAERMGRAAPFIDDPRVFLCNSGAEAVDGAFKLARRTTGRPGVIAFRHAFHGRTMAATSITTAKPKYQEGYAPLLADVHIAPYCHRAGDLSASLAELDGVIAAAGDGAIGAMLVEPVLGEGGYVVPPREWLLGLRERCDRHGILLVFDEVQTGIGRTGAMFAAETFDVRPDVVLFAKGIASGLPLGGLILPAALAGRWPRGAHGSTFGGNPLACAAALATLDVIQDGDLCARAKLLGDRARAVLSAAAKTSSDVVEVRGVGLMIGIEMRDGTAAARVQAECLDQGVLVLTCGPDDHVLRVIPPLTITDAELDNGLAVLGSAL